MTLKALNPSDREIRTVSDTLRVAPKLRKAAESVLQKGGTLSGFLEESLRTHVTRRKLQQEFVARGLAARDEARRTGQYVAAGQALLELRDLLAARKAKKR